MTFPKRAASALAIAISLAACSDNKNETTEVKKESAAQVVPATKNADARFQELLAYVPAETAYVFANKQAIPADVLDFHLKRSKQMLSVFQEVIADGISKKPASGMQESTDVNNDNAKDASESQSPDKAEAEKLEKFYQSLLNELTENMESDKLTNIGVKADGHSAFYGVNLWPVLRYEISSKTAVTDFIKRAEKESGYVVKWEQCGDHDCINAGDEEYRIALVIQEGQIALSFFSKTDEAVMLDHLAGKNKPETSLAPATWNAFLSENKYQGYGDGYVNLKKVYSKAEPLFFAEMKKEAEQNGRTFDEQSLKNCSSLVSKHVDNMPEIVFGMTKLEKQSMDYEMLLKTTPAISSAIEAIPNQVSGLQQAVSPIFDMGFNINFGKLRDGLSQYTNYLVTAAEEVKCDAVDPAEIRKAMGGLSMATMMGANQFKALYVAANDISMNDQGEPEKIDLFASVVAEDPGALLQMLAMVNPAFGSISLPKDGSTMELPKELLPPNPKGGVNPGVYLSQNDQILNVMVGNDKPALQALNAEKPALFWSSVDSKRYYAILGDVMKNMPADQGDEAQKSIDMLTKLNDFAGKVRSEMRADSRGIVFKNSATYE